MQSTPTTHSGFTLLELMVSITVLAVLLGLGVPAFNQIVRNNQTAAQTNQLVTALSLARSEATKRGIPVSVCASNVAQTACAAVDTAAWTNGWLVFADRLGDPGVLDDEDGDEILLVFESVTDGIELTSNDTGFVRFAGSGARTNPGDITFSVEHQHCTGDNRRTITINATGRATLAKVACT